jgi:hypothetical protein
MLTLTQPYNKASVITKSDTVNIAVATPVGTRTFTDAIYIGGAGTVTVVFEDDTTAAFTCVAGQILPVKAKRVNATGTAATLLLAMFAI